MRPSVSIQSVVSDKESSGKYKTSILAGQVVLFIVIIEQVTTLHHVVATNDNALCEVELN